MWPRGFRETVYGLCKITRNLTVEEVIYEPMHKVQQCGGTNRDFCGPVWVKNKPISVPASVKPFYTASGNDISSIENFS